MYPKILDCRFFDEGEQEEDDAGVLAGDFADNRNLLFCELWFEFWMLCNEFWRVFCRVFWREFCNEFCEFCELCIEFWIELLCRFMF